MTLEDTIALVHRHGWTIHTLGEHDSRWDCSLRIDEWTYGFGSAATLLEAVERATLDACHKQIARVERARTLREKPAITRRSLDSLLGDLP